MGYSAPHACATIKSRPHGSQSPNPGGTIGSRSRRSYDGTGTGRAARAASRPGLQADRGGDRDAAACAGLGHLGAVAQRHDRHRTYADPRGCPAPGARAPHHRPSATRSAVSETDVVRQLCLLETRREIERLVCRSAARRATDAERRQFARLAKARTLPPLLVPALQAIRGVAGDRAPACRDRAGHRHIGCRCGRQGARCAARQHRGIHAKHRGLTHADSSSPPSGVLQLNRAPSRFNSCRTSAPTMPLGAMPFLIESTAACPIA